MTEFRPSAEASSTAPSSWASSEAVRRVMRANTARDTRPEKAIRGEAHRRGLRFRVDTAPLPGVRRRADMVFTSARVAVYVDGCYWHGCPDHYRPATRNADFWADKVTTTRLRDLDTNERMARAGWRVLRIWEHENVSQAVDRLERLVRSHQNGAL